MTKPFTFNASALAIIPVSAIKALTAEDQIDAIWEAADDPFTPRDRSLALIGLVNKLTARVRNRPGGDQKSEADQLV